MDEVTTEFSALPRHIAIIMDGNGRWAQERGKLRMMGHRAGAETVRRMVEECGRLGVEALTLYSFSLENWKRPADEVEALMGLALEHLVAERASLVQNNVQFRLVGQREGLPEAVLEAIDATAEATRDCTGLTMSLAMNYSGRSELAHAARAIAERVERGELRSSDVDESTIESHLWTHGLPDPDLMIRTAGEMRISNFLLWQLSYSELYVTDVLWPDFDCDDLHRAIHAYGARDRRYGGVK